MTADRAESGGSREDSGFVGEDPAVLCQADHDENRQCAFHEIEEETDAPPGLSDHASYVGCTDVPAPGEPDVDPFGFSDQEPGGD